MNSVDLRVFRRALGQMNGTSRAVLTNEKSLAGAIQSAVISQLDAKTIEDVGSAVSMNEKHMVLKLISKVPTVTLGFRIIKILATTLGEIGGDTVTIGWLGETTDHPGPFGYPVGQRIWYVRGQQDRAPRSKLD